MKLARQRISCFIPTIPQTPYCFQVCLIPFIKMRQEHKEFKQCMIKLLRNVWAGLELRALCFQSSLMIVLEHSIRVDHSFRAFSMLGHTYVGGIPWSLQCVTHRNITGGSDQGAYQRCSQHCGQRGWHEDGSALSLMELPSPLGLFLLAGERSH